MKINQTICARDCYDSCPLSFEIDDDGRVIRSVADSGHSFVASGGCARSAADVKRLYTGRIETPMLRTLSGYSPISWDEAIEILANKISELSVIEQVKKIAFVNYAGNQGLLSLVYPERFWRKIGATLTDRAVCTKTGHLAIKAHYGNSFGLDAYSLSEYKVLIYWGMNLAVTAPHQWKKAVEWRKHSGGKIVVIDVVKTETSKRADLFIQIRPQTDVALVFALMQNLIKHQQHDIDFIARNTSGFDALSASVFEFSIEKLAEMCGVNILIINMLSDLYAQNKPSATFIGVGVQKHTNGFDQVRAVSFIPTILGQHRGYFYSNGQSTLVDEAYLSGEAIYGQAHTTSQVHLASDLLAGKFRLLFVSTMNPAVTLPNSTSFISGMNRPDVFVCVHDTHHTETSKHADLILPALTYLEKTDLILPWGHHRVRLSKPVCEPVTQGKSEIELMHLLAKKMGLSDDFLFENPIEALKKYLKPAIDNVDEFIDSQIFTDLRKKNQTSYPTKSGKIEFLSENANTYGFLPLPVPKCSSVPEGFFQLISGASPKYTNSQFEESNGKRYSEVFINETDAGLLKIQNSDTVILKNQLGELHLTAQISDKTPQGVLFTYRLANGLLGGTINNLISDVPQFPDGGGPLFNSCFVELILDL